MIWISVLAIFVVIYGIGRRMLGPVSKALATEEGRMGRL